MICYVAVKGSGNDRLEAISKYLVNASTGRVGDSGGHINKREIKFGLHELLESRNSVRWGWID